MLSWHFRELVKSPVTFVEQLSYPELVEQRFDIVSLDSISVSGTIQFNGNRGKLQMKVNVVASVLAANTGEVVPFNDEIEIEETLSLLVNDFIDAEAEMIDLNQYVQTMIDVSIPTHVVDDRGAKVATVGNNWSMVDEDDYVSTKEIVTEQKKLSNLSALLAQKINK
ncbi:MAG: hypothetical protein ACRC6X_08680 [Culicoidibacterales bacterium]